jgi:hypothetical protein
MEPEQVAVLAAAAGFPLAPDRCQAVADEWNATLGPHFAKVDELDLGTIAPAVRFSAIRPEGMSA